MKEHKKPTTPAAHVRVFAGGGAEREVLTLSSSKPEQEKQAFAQFAKLFNETSGREMSNAVALDEADHDFTASIDGQSTVIQLAELSQHVWSRDAPPANQKFRLELSLSGGSNHYVDTAAYDGALRSLIAKKLAKHYAKPEAQAFWLVIFSTAYYPLELGNVITPGMQATLDLLAVSNDQPFDEVWFMNLQNAPLRIWPRL